MMVSRSAYPWPVEIRPLRSFERDAFVDFSSDARENERLRSHLERALAARETSLDSCLVADDDGRFAGRVYLWKRPDNPIFVHLFDLDWSRADWRDLGLRLIDAALDAAGETASNGIVYALDRPHPWHSHPERRAELFETAGFKLIRRGQRWERKGGSDDPHAREGLSFRTLAEVGEEAFRHAIARVSDGTLDARLQEMRARLGREGDAAQHFRLLMGLAHEPGWWQLASNADGDLVGLFVAGGDVTGPVIAYVGVVPERRGHRYVDDLLARAIATLTAHGAQVIRADTDLANVPMANAFARAGFEQFRSRDEYLLSSEDLRRHRMDT
jgi:RimJ/RimL family protein N-acetyltransferase